MYRKRKKLILHNKLHFYFNLIIIFKYNIILVIIYELFIMKYLLKKFINQIL